MFSARDFRGSRRDLALVFSEKPRTIYEAAKALGRPTGSIYRLVQRMADANLLLADSDPPVRGTMYRLNPEARAALDEAAAGAHATGLLMQGQKLLVVRGGPGRLALQQLLLRPTVAGALAWAATVDGGGMLLALAPDAASLQRDKLAVALEQADFKYREIDVGEIFAAGDVRARAQALLEVAETVK
jgi:hypothetical protein